MTPQTKGIAWALGGAFCTVGFAIPWKVASQHGDSTTNTLILLCAAAAFNSLLTVSQKRSFPTFRRFDVQVAVALAVFTLLGNLASGYAIALVSPALLVVVMRGEVIIVALLASAVLSERIDGRYWIGAAIAAFGLFLLNDPFNEVDPINDGVAWAVAAALSFSSMSIVTRKFIHRIDTVSVNALRLWLAIGFWFAFNGIPEELRQINGPQVLHASLAAFFGPFLGRLCLMTSARYVEARFTSLATLSAPPLTLLLAWILLDDLPLAHEVHGSVIMLLGISIPLLGWMRARSKDSTK